MTQSWPLVAAQQALVGKWGSVSMALKSKQIVPTSSKILKRSLQTFLHACVVYVLLYRNRKSYFKPSLWHGSWNSGAIHSGFCSSNLNFSAKTVSQCRYIYSVWILNSWDWDLQMKGNCIYLCPLGCNLGFGDVLLDLRACLVQVCFLLCPVLWGTQYVIRIK